MIRKLALVAMVIGTAWAMTGAAVARGIGDPPELGRILWLRDFDAATVSAKASGKPLLVLFDEVPGCRTCQDFGTGPLSHPLVVEAAREFVAVAVYNNKPGPDAALLARFKEPSWNNPVLRYLDAEGRDLVPRQSGDYTAGGVLSRMAASLEAAGRAVPEYLRLVAFEHAPRARDTGVFAMYCYWEGERKLGALDGVLATRIGSLGGHEIVEVIFDPTVLTYAALLEKAREMSCATRVFARTEEQFKIAKSIAGTAAVRSDAAIDDDTEQQYHLAHAPAYWLLPLTALQATKANAALARRESPDRFLSPGQVELAASIRRVRKEDAGRFAALTPDRTPRGLPAYARRLEEALAGR